MTTTVDYYFATISPFGYLGHDRFVAMASKHRATVNVKPTTAAAHSQRILGDGIARIQIRAVPRSNNHCVMSHTDCA